ncbi:MAG: UDP-N-acetylmuramoyl-L-alanine--D-glutamate ligase [Flavobacteriaceae bacterium]|nr:UDP-N-acetylmuramoyl-L-alanine--D-glutamate ligase [Flavobacteriaceae bacterium]
MKKVIILGAGESGLGSAELAKKNFFEVFVSDYGKINHEAKRLLEKLNIQYEENSHDFAMAKKTDLVIKSPGIPEDSKIINYFKSIGIKVISEIEFAYSFSSSIIIGVTGSNGKTTTSTLINKLISDANISCSLSGNIGNSFSKVCDKFYKYSVIELSSFQLDGIENFKPHIAVLTGITPDHLDRYENYKAYINSKFKIVKNQDFNDYLIYNSDCEVINNYIKSNKINSKLIPFSTNNIVNQGAYYLDNKINITIEKNKINMPTNNFLIKGNHNIKNAMAAATVANLLKIRKETIRKSLEHFQGVEHRLENVLTINKVSYINDSKATNVNAAYYALESMETPTIWIVGGIDKGNDYSELIKLVENKVKAIICLGLNNMKIIHHFENNVELIIETKSMKDAVDEAYKISSAGDTVLLSPACASFDLFEDFEDRGRQFKSAVRKL